VKVGAVAEQPSFTVTASVNISAGSHTAIIASHGVDGLSGSAGWELVAFDQTLTFVVGIGNGQQAQLAAPSIPFDTWSFVAAAFDGTTLRACKDAACVTSGIDSGTFAPATNHDFRIGDGYRDRGTPATIDELRVYNRALSEAEIQAVRAL
jgi:hypothetical protein